MRAASSFFQITSPLVASSANSVAVLLAKNTRFPSVVDPATRGISGRTPSGDALHIVLPVSASRRATFPAALVTIKDLPESSGVVATPPSKDDFQRTAPVAASNA